jgi:uncharacterized protein DUF4912
MDRPSLETLSRDELITRARAAGIARPEVLTRAELVDELLRRSSADAPARSKARGFFGRARDLIATIIERGLHLPDAAQRIRNPVPVDEDPVPPAPVATVTLAEIYAAQGHLERALGVLDELLTSEPDHAQARALSQRLRTGPPLTPAAADPRPEPDLVGELGSSPAAPVAEAPAAETLSEAAAALEAEAEPPGPGKRPMLDDSPLPERYDVDEAVVMPVDPTTAFVYWELRESTLARARQTAPQGRLLIRLFVETATWQGAISETRDIITEATIGDYFVFGLPEGAVLRASIGWLVGDEFDLFASGPAYNSPAATPSRLVATTLVRWTPEVSVLPTPIEPPPDLADALSAMQGAGPLPPSRPAHLPLTIAPQRRPPPRAGADERTPPEWLWSDELIDWPPLGSSEHRAPGQRPPTEDVPLGASEQAPWGASEQWGVRYLGAPKQPAGPLAERAGMRNPLALTFAFFAFLLTPAAFAQSPPSDPEVLLEREGEPVDPDDLAPALRRSTERGFSTPPVRLSLLAWHQEAFPFARDRGLGLVLTLPLEAMLAPSARALRRREAVEPGPPATLPFERTLGPTSTEPLPPATTPAAMSGTTPASANEAAPGALPAALQVSAEELSVLSSAALRVAGLAAAVDGRLDGMAARARSSALLPELRLRATQSNDQALRLSYADADPYRTQTTGGSALLFEARATWRLDRMLYADDEVAVEKMRVEVREQRQRVLVKLAEAVGAWQRAQGVLLDSEASPRERADAGARAAGAAVLLDTLTGGAWSRSRERVGGGATGR